MKFLYYEHERASLARRYTTYGTRNNRFAVVAWVPSALRASNITLRGNNLYIS